MIHKTFVHTTLIIYMDYLRPNKRRRMNENGDYVCESDGTVVSTLQLCLEHVQAIKSRTNNILYNVQDLVSCIRDTLSNLADACNMEGHSFVQSPNGDYHSPGYYYVCSRCDYFTSIKPESYK